MSTAAAAVAARPPVPKSCLTAAAPAAKSTVSLVGSTRRHHQAPHASSGLLLRLSSSSTKRFVAAASAAAAAVHKVKLVGPDGAEHEFEAPEDTYILEAAENAGVELPFSCRAGSCSTCAGKMSAGEVDQSEGSFLDEGQVADEYLLTCISYPKADCVIHTHKEEELY